MRALIIFTLTVLIEMSCSANVPSGFIPLPPLPVKNKPTAKTTLPPITQKPTQKPTIAPVTQLTKTTMKPTPPTTTTARPTPAPTTQLPPSKTVIVPTSKPNCGLNINLPNANCNSGGNSAVQLTLSSLKQELDKSRQQSQAQNSALQSIITKLQTQQVGYLTKIADLQNEVKNLVQAFNSLSGKAPLSTVAPPVVTSGISSPILQQAVQNVRQDLSTAVTTFNREIFNLSSQLQSSTQQELKIHQSIESQIQQQAGDIGRLTQQVKDLERLLQQVNNTNGNNNNNNGGGATNSDIAKLQAQISKVENDIKQYSNNQRSQLSNLTLQTGALQASVANNSNSIAGLKTSLLISQGKINQVDSDVTVVHDALAQFRKLVLPRMSQMENDIKTLQSDVTQAQTSVGNVGKSVFNLVMQSGKDKQTLNGLEKQTTQLKTDVTSLQSDLQAQKTEISNIQSGMVNLKNSVPIQELNDMNNIILTILQNQNGSQPTAQQLQKLTQAITKITSKLQNLTIPGPVSG